MIPYHARLKAVLETTCSRARVRMVCVSGGELSEASGSPRHDLPTAQERLEFAVLSRRMLLPVLLNSDSYHPVMSSADF